MSALIPVSLIPQAMPRTATANGAETARAFAPSVLIGLLRNPEFKAMIASGINLEESTFAIQGVNVSSNARGEQGIYKVSILSSTPQAKPNGLARRGISFIFHVAA